MKTLSILLVATFFITTNILSQDNELNTSIASAIGVNKNINTFSKKDAVMMQNMTSLDRTENWNKLFNNSPTVGFIVFDTDENDHFFFNGEEWERVIDVKRDMNGEIINQKMVAKNE